MNWCTRLNAETTPTLLSPVEDKTGRDVNKMLCSAAKYVFLFVTRSHLVIISAMMSPLKATDRYTSFLLNVIQLGSFLLIFILLSMRHSRGIAQPGRLFLSHWFIFNCLKYTSCSSFSKNSMRFLVFGGWDSTKFTS